jgi:hypothetical protein
MAWGCPLIPLSDWQATMSQGTSVLVDIAGLAGSIEPVSEYLVALLVSSQKLKARCLTSTYGRSTSQGANALFQQISDARPSAS